MLSSSILWNEKPLCLVVVGIEISGPRVLLECSRVWNQTEMYWVSEARHTFTQCGGGGASAEQTTLVKPRANEPGPNDFVARNSSPAISPIAAEPVWAL